MHGYAAVHSRGGLFVGLVAPEQLARAGFQGIDVILVVGKDRLAAVNRNGRANARYRSEKPVDATASGIQRKDESAPAADVQAPVVDGRLVAGIGGGAGIRNDECPLQSCARHLRSGQVETGEVPAVARVRRPGGPGAGNSVRSQRLGIAEVRDLRRRLLRSQTAEIPRDRPAFGIVQPDCGLPHDAGPQRAVDVLGCELRETGHTRLYDGRTVALGAAFGEHLFARQWFGVVGR